ncbi:poly(a)-specific ribonuclease parn, partial [Plakobranchus ocellatus]
MEITKHTFNEQLDSILTAIEESTFLAIDGEFTGLDAEGCSHIAPFDTPEERYLKLRHGSTDFMLIQFGLCAFKVDEEKRIYEAKPYNFYVFPRPSSRNAPDRRFMCQSSSLDFLICNGFDFNKLIKEGISYLSLEQEHKMKAELERKHAEQKNRSASSVLSPDGANSKKMPLPVPDDQKEFLTDICERISVFLEGDDEELKLQSCNAFQRKLVYQTVEEKYPLVHLQTKTGEKKERFLVVQRAKDAEDLEKKEQEKQALEKMELDLQVGFTKVIKAITKSGKLVVGHNMFLDIIHSMNQFHSVLPYNLVDFKAMVKTVFPRLLDTKLLANTPPLKDFMTYTSLNDLQETMQSKPFSPVPVKPAPGFDLYNSGSVALHEAGYDAYITGCCFATMCKFL